MNKLNKLRFVTELADQPGFAQRINLWEIIDHFLISLGDETTFVYSTPLHPQEGNIFINFWL